MDCAKGINFLLTNDGQMQDYQGYGKAIQPMLPSIGIPHHSRYGQRGPILRPYYLRRYGC